MASNYSEIAGCSSSLSFMEAPSETGIETDMTMEQYRCEICRIPVHQKMYFSDRRFGLLEHCMHMFCLSCIRSQRAKPKRFYFFKKNKEYEEALPSPVICPVCRVPSMFIVSSTKWIQDKVEKAMYFAEYKRNTQEIFCPWIRFGQGRCLSTKCEIRGNHLRP
ncbi:RING-type domain-containing protein [Caerostris darwini]|uniref:RING-type domain-containing protein n=1 Tax=Caerostris darwini TaxID=1538125 RepID=A0AAV4SQI9_9ARAC|nr:RING-type domain-containing protein [Caerostris darwini]